MEPNRTRLKCCEEEFLNQVFEEIESGQLSPSMRKILRLFKKIEKILFAHLISMCRKKRKHLGCKYDKLMCQIPPREGTIDFGVVYKKFWEQQQL